MRLTAKVIVAAAFLAVSGGHALAEDLVPSLERLANAGNAEAMYYLGMAYHTGSGVAQDRAKALDLFQKAAALGDPLASYKLGCYYDGQGGGLVQDDATLALKFKLVAAEAGYALAQHDAGVLYAYSGDMDAGQKWVEESAAQGWPDSLLMLAMLHNDAPGVVHDAAKTAAYFRLFLTRTKPSDEQTEWLKTFEESLSPDDKRRAAEIVSSYRSAPTQLTLDALSGQRAAEALVAASMKN